jgi:hypothetical protein
MFENQLNFVMVIFKFKVVLQAMQQPLLLKVYLLQVTLQIVSIVKQLPQRVQAVWQR